MSSIRGNSLAVAAAVLLAVARASAQTNGGDAAMAETLFKEAKELMTRSDFATACPKLAESNRLDPGTGTLTALALCHEAQGKTASAWAEFIEVENASQRAQRTDRVELAHQHIAQLEKVIPHLSIVVSDEARVAGLKVLRDDVAVGTAAWSSPITVDPGEHVIVAEAEGYKPFTVRITLGPSETKAVTVLALDPLAKTEPLKPVPETPQETKSDGKTQRIAGIVVGAVGLVTIGVGSVFGAEAISNASSASSRCTPQLCTDAGAVQLNEDAKHDALAADITLGIGLAVTVVGVIVFLVAPHAPAPRAAMLRFVF